MRHQYTWQCYIQGQHAPVQPPPPPPPPPASTTATTMHAPPYSPAGYNRCSQYMQPNILENKYFELKKSWGTWGFQPKGVYAVMSWRGCPHALGFSPQAQLQTHNQISAFGSSHQLF